MGKTMSSTENLTGMAGSASGGMSFLGSYNMCHALCMGTVSLLSMAGITLGNLPFLFLQDYAPYFWGLGLTAFLASLPFYFVLHHAIMKKWITLNAGFLLAGIPFAAFRDYLPGFQVMGLGLVLYAAWLWRTEKGGKKNGC